MLVQYIQYTYLRRCNDIDYRMAAEIYIPISFVGCTIYKSAFGVYVRHLLQAGYERVSLVQKIFGDTRTEYAFAIQHYLFEVISISPCNHQLQVAFYCNYFFSHLFDSATSDPKLIYPDFSARSISALYSSRVTFCGSMGLVQSIALFSDIVAIVCSFIYKFLQM